MKCLAITKKDIQMYYAKGPVIIFGILLPLFLFFAFLIGRHLSPGFLMVGLLSMSVFFTSTAVTPVITPWEAQMGTLERIVSCPISIKAILFGDIIASLIFGVSISIVPIIVGMIFGIKIYYPLLLFSGVVISAFCFSSFSVLFSAYPSNMPSTVMMISSLIRFPLIFLSGIFIPLNDLPEWGKIVAYISPLTYLTDLTRFSLGLKSNILWYLNLGALVVFSVIFLLLSFKLHAKVLLRRLQH